MADEKYVVLKKSDWDDLYEDCPITCGTVPVVEDAVVIRTRDIFAGPVLHTYAGAVQTAIEVIEGSDSDHVYDLEDLHRVRDYFHQRALEADAQQQKRFPKAP